MGPLAGPLSWTLGMQTQPLQGRRVSSRHSGKFSDFPPELASVSQEIPPGPGHQAELLREDHLCPAFMTELLKMKYAILGCPMELGKQQIQPLGGGCL